MNKDAKQLDSKWLQKHSQNCHQENNLKEMQNNYDYQKKPNHQWPYRHTKQAQRDTQLQKLPKRD